MVETYSFLVQNLVLPIYDVARRTSRFKVGKVLSKTQWFSRQEIEHLQDKNLRALLRHAYNNVPYYHRIFKERNLYPDAVQTTKDLFKLPILTKKDIRKHFVELISRAYPEDNFVPRTSGGTGDQIRFYVTKKQMSWEVAAEFRAYSWGNYHLGNKCSMFWGSPIDATKQKALTNRFTTCIERVQLLNTHVVSDQALSKCAAMMERFEPEVIRGYASSVYLMARYLNKRDLVLARPKAVFTSAETLFPFQRKTIEETFGCPVFDYYGSREIGAIAAECEQHSGYHVSAENVAVECIKDSEQVEEGERGVMLITNLRNFGMPFIRYAIGDVGKPSNEVCNCGRGLPLLESIEGRVSQFMAVYDKNSGQIIPMSTAAPGPISMTLMRVPLESYRIIQESLDRIIIKAVKGEGYSQKHTDFVINHMQEILGTNVKIEFEFLSYLPSLPSGKRSVFVSKINSFQTQ